MNNFTLVAVGVLIGGTMRVDSKEGVEGGLGVAGALPGLGREASKCRVAVRILVNRSLKLEGTVDWSFWSAVIGSQKGSVGVGVGVHLF